MAHMYLWWLNRLATTTFLTCDSNAQCQSAACSCITNFYGNGLSCQRTLTRSIPVARRNGRNVGLTAQAIHTTGSVCLPDSITRPEGVYVFNFTNAGSVATVTCPIGYAGTATRLCNAAGNVQYGVWADANINCARTCS
jgi:hypothetical protein